MLNSSPEPVKILYGETYDSFGITVDSLKYYFSLAILVKGLKKQGIASKATVLIADRAATMNPSVKDRDSLMAEGQRRKEYFQRLTLIYHLPVEFVLMSNYAAQTNLEVKCLEVQRLIEKSPKAARLVEKTVLINKIKQERSANFRYAAEAIAVSNGFDIKIGPPREIYYDKVSTLIGKPYCGIYLKPTFPLGQNFLFYLQNPEIEKFGLTPYKAGSNKLQDYRVILGKTTPEEVSTLVEKTEIFPSEEAASPTKDLLSIGQMAQVLLGERPERNEDIKKEAVSSFRRFIYEPLAKGGLYEQRI